MGRWLGGLALSVPLRLAILMIAASGIVALPPVPTEPTPVVQVTHVSLAPKPATPREPMLVEQADLFTDIPSLSAQQGTASKAVALPESVRLSDVEIQWQSEGGSFLYDELRADWEKLYWHKSLGACDVQIPYPHVCLRVF